MAADYTCNLLTMDQRTGKIMTVEIPGEMPKGACPPKSAGSNNDFRTFRYEDILEFLNEVESQFDAKLKEHDEWVKTNIKAVNSSDEAESIAVDRSYRWGYGMPFVLSASVFTYAYGRLEHCLHELCRLIQNIRKAKCGPEDLRGRGFIQSQNYLEKIIGIEWTVEDKEALQTIRIYGTIRNAIAHNNGILRQDEKDAEAHIRKTDGIELDKERHLEVSPQFVHNAILGMNDVYSLISRQTERVAGLDDSSNPSPSGPATT